MVKIFLEEVKCFTVQHRMKQTASPGTAAHIRNAAINSAKSTLQYENINPILQVHTRWGGQEEKEYYKHYCKNIS